MDNTNNKYMCEKCEDTGIILETASVGYGDDFEVCMDCCELIDGIYKYNKKTNNELG